MLRKRGERALHGGWPKASGFSDGLKAPAERPLSEIVRLERDAPRALSVFRVAEELRMRGDEVELFEDVSSPAGQAVAPIHLRRGGEDVFVEVETSPWEKKTTESVLKTAAVLRGSVYSDASFEVLGAYPVPEEVRYFCGRTPAALFQLDLVHHDDLDAARACAEAFVRAVERHWGMVLYYDPEELPPVEELLISVFGSNSGNGTRVPVLDALVHGFGCYAGEILRRHAESWSLWRLMSDWGEDLVVEFTNATADPIGKARAFLENGPRDSVAYYVAYVLRELNG